MEECVEKSGFLFPHSCGNPVAHVCADCQKPICDQHTVTESETRYLCTTCAKKSMAAQAQNRPADWYHGNPYFYYHCYYPDYYYYGWHHGHTPGIQASLPAGAHDFTDSDQAALGGDFSGGGDFDSAGPEDADDFENDMGGS